MKILGIETSCDDTAMAVIEVQSEKRKVKSGEKIMVSSNIISSQVKLHAKYGGVVPNLAAREHAKNIGHVFDLALEKAGIKNFKKEIDAIAVTRGPGLGPALLVGISFAKTISWIYKKPLIGVNHLEGHIYSNWLPPIGINSNLKFLIFKKEPALNLIVSGGHTELVLMRGIGDYKLIGETLDDAVGEAFDKVARLLGLGYPGGPALAQRASKFKVESSKLKVPILFPRPMIHSKDYNFSFSGLKTAVLYKIRDLKNAGAVLTDSVVNEIAHAFQEAAIDVLITKTIRAARKFNAKSIFLSGGVSANKLLRERLEKAVRKHGLNYSQPPLAYTGDNAAMIAIAGYFNCKKNRRDSLKPVQMDANLTF